MPACNLVLIGFMGAGKSAAGREIAKRLRVPRVDLDEKIAEQFQLSISDIFARFGEAAFRDAESGALAGLALSQPSVVVTGGGTVLRPQNVELLRRLGPVAYLTADRDTIFARVSRRPSRPLLVTENPRATLEELLQAREPLYRAAADFEVETSHLTHAEVADVLIEYWHGIAVGPGEAGAP